MNQQNKNPRQSRALMEVVAILNGPAGKFNLQELVQSGQTSRYQGHRLSIAEARQARRRRLREILEGRPEMR